MSRSGFIFLAVFSLAFYFASCSGRVPSDANIVDGLAEDSTADMNFYNLYVDEDDSNRKMQYAEIFLSKLDTASVNPAAAQMCDTLADYYENVRHLFSKAISYSERALRIYEANGMKHPQAECLYRLAKLYYKQGAYHKTLQYTDRALKLFEEEKDEMRALDCYNLLGMVYQLCRDYDVSKKFFAKYVDGVRRNNDSSRFVYALNNAAVLENTLGDTLKTLKLIEQSLEISKDLGDSAVICRVSLNSAGICMNMGLFDKSLIYLDTAYAYVGDNVEYLGEYHLFKGLNSYQKNDYDSAIRSIIKAKDCYSSGEFDMRIRDCWLKLQHLYELKGNTDSAYVCLKRYDELRERLRSEEMFLELFKAQNQIILSREHDKMYREKVRGGIILFTVLAAALVAASVTVVIYRKKKNSIVLNEQKLKAEKDLYHLKALQKFQMDRLIEDIVSRLSKLSSHTGEASVRNTLKSICNDLMSGRDDDQWKEISNYIPDSESEFLSKLVSDFPDLTTNERRLCVLLNKNLSTKEISEITRQSIKSINVARTRLRGKLGITGSDTLIQDVLSKYN